MTRPDDDRALDAALGRAPAGLTPDEAREAARLRAAFSALGAAARPLAPDPALKARVMARATGEVPAPRWLPWTLAAAAALAVGLALCARQPLLRIAETEGPVTLNGRPAEPGDAVLRGALLEAGPGGAALLVRPGRATLLARDGARLRAFRGPLGTAVHLERGALFSNVRPGTRFSVRTPAAVAAVRGTTFYASVADPERAYVCLCRGKLRVSVRGQDRVLAAESHTAVQTGPGGISDAGMKGHTDADAARLALR